MTLPHGLIVLFILYFSGAILPKNIVKSSSSKKTWKGRGGVVYRRVLNFLDTITIFHVSYNRNYDDDDDDDDDCFCGMVDQRKAFSLTSSRGHCQRSSPSQISDTPWAGFEPAQKLSSGLVEWSCAVVITTTPRRHEWWLLCF